MKTASAFTNSQRPLKTWLATLAALSLLAGTVYSAGFGHDYYKCARTRMTINAGTVFNLDASGPMPWGHQVRGIAQVSGLGNCNVFFDVTINPGINGHVFDLAGTLTITTLAGDKLTAQVAGWADPDANDPKPNPTHFGLYYSAKILGGTGQLAGARGQGDITGAFMFSGNPGEDADLTDDRFCDSYAGVATWRFDGVLVLPRCRPVRS